MIRCENQLHEGENWRECKNPAKYHILVSTDSHSQNKNPVYLKHPVCTNCWILWVRETAERGEGFAYRRIE